jgi:hypothetical protein
MKQRTLKNASGFTLVEVMVFSVVSLMFIGLLAQVFIMATRRTEDSRLRVDIQQSAVLILKSLERDIAKTSTRAMAASDSGTYAFAITPIVGWSGAPVVAWAEQQVIYCHDPTKKTLHREVYPPKSPSWAEDLTSARPYIPTSAELQAVSTTPSGQERILSPYVEEFKLTDRSGRITGFQSNPLILRMKLQRPLSTSGRHTEFTVERRYTLRNAF